MKTGDLVFLREGGGRSSLEGVAHLTHYRVVKVVGGSSGIPRIQIADLYGRLVLDTRGVGPAEFPSDHFDGVEEACSI